MKVLLLNATYSPISFVSDTKALKMFAKGKVDILSAWSDVITWSSGKMNIPAVMKLKYNVRWIPRKSKFSRLSVFKRDKCMCGYCGNKFKISELTLDHIVPKDRGGKMIFNNIVSACFPCNNKKKNRTPDEAHMKLLLNPRIPNLSIRDEMELLSPIHSDWDMYCGN